MKRNSSIIGWVLVGVIVIVAFLTCPDQQDHKEAIQKDLIGTGGSTGDTSDAIAKAVGGLFVGAVLDGTLNVKNYLLFSVGKVTNPFTGESKNVSWGSSVMSL